MNKYFRIDILQTNAGIHCLFINNDVERKDILDTVKEHKEPKHLELKNKNLLKKYFNAKELGELGETTTLFISDYGLYNDDTIDEVKMKLIQCCKKHKIELSYDEIYLFINSFSQTILSQSGKEGETPDKVSHLYDFLSKNKKQQITWEELCIQLLNYGKYGVEICEKIDKKMYYYYDDLKPYDELINKIDLYFYPISHYFTTLNDRVNFIHNPFIYFDFINMLLERTPEIFKNDSNPLYSKYIDNSKLILNNGDETLSTMNSKALYEFNIDGSIIYAFLPSIVSLDKNILKTQEIENKGFLDLIVKNINSVYIPKLNNVYKEDLSLDNTLLREAFKNTKDRNEKEYIKHFTIIDLFHSLDIEPIKANYDGLSVNSLELNYYQDAPFQFPCEFIFKKVNTTEIMPYVKYNPGYFQENLVRLFSRGLSAKGHKVPILTKSHIQKLNSKNTQHESLTYFFKLDKEMFDGGKHTKFTKNIYDTLLSYHVPKGDYGLKMVFNNDSSITYSIKCTNNENNVSIDALFEVIQLITTPVLKFIQQELFSMGPQLTLLTSFIERNIEIQFINSVMKYKGLKLDNLDFTQFVNCYSKYLSKQESIGKIKNNPNTMHFMYKRISNYLKTDAIEASIIQFINSGYGEDAIVKFLISNYDISEIVAKEKFIAMLSQINVERTMFPNRKLRVKNNPGLSTEISNVPFSNEITVSIENIKSISLMHIIGRTFFSILSVVSGQLGSSKKEIIKSCKGGTEKVFEITDTNAVVEKPIEQNQPSKSLVSNLLEVKMKAQAISFDFDDDAKDNEAEVDELMDNDLLDLLVGDKDDEIDSDLLDLVVHADEDDQDEDLLVDKSGNSNQSNRSDDPLEMGGGNDVTGMNLSNPNPFFDKMHKLDPKLFLKQKTNQFNAYSRMCPWNVRRQPVILTQEEKDKIDKENPGSYDKAIKYGSSKDNEYYYICPRYWCLKNNVSLTEEQVKAGECGGVDAIIPRNAKKVPPGKHIFEFYADAEHKEKDGTYIKHFPGFISGDKHPDGLCIPCCFKAWDSDLQKKRRKECITKTDASDAKKSEADQPKPTLDQTVPPKITKKIKIKTKKERDAVIHEDQYIIGVDKFPLPIDRLGMLPIEIQMFLNVDNNECFQDLQTHKIKLNHKCILRQGVELHSRKSFIAVLSNAYAPYSKDKKIKTIGSMCNYLSEIITLDMFKNAQNGSLVSMFFNPSDYGKIDPKKIKEYSETSYYKKVNFNNFSQQMEFKKSVVSFENFKNYLKRKSSYIDHEILWDLVSMPNSKLFPRGINLVILNIPEDDMTNNVEIICPSNSYSSMFYNSRKSTLLLIKKNDFYEPIYTYEETEKNINIEKLFNEFNQALLPSLKTFLEKIKAYLQECVSKPNVEYAKIFKQGNTITEIENAVKKIKGTIDTFVVNSSFKVIGLEVSFEIKELKYKKIYVPCIPYAVDLSTLDTKVITSDEIQGHSFKSTIKSLEFFNSLSPRINCQPYGKVIEEKIIVGIITNTNQFVPINPPINENSDQATYGAKLIVLNSYDERTLSEKISEFLPSLVSTSEIVLSQKDVLKVFNKYKLSLLEQQLFQYFRNKIKILFQFSSNETLTKELQTITKSSKSYHNKMNAIKKLIKKIVIETNSVKFIPLKEFSKHAETIIKNKKENIYYLEDSDTLKLPKENLINPTINNAIYYIEKISDELIRYTRVYDFILNSGSNVGYSHVEYQLRPNEVVLPVSELSASLYDELSELSKYYDIIYSYDFFNAQPQIKQTYDNTVVAKDKTKTVRKIMIRKKKKPTVLQKPSTPTSEKKNSDGNYDLFCKTTDTVSLRGKWKTIMGTKFKTTIYEGSKTCSYSLICDIINHFNKYPEDNPLFVKEIDIRNKLSDIYGSLTSDETENLQTLLSLDGKTEFSRQLKTKALSLKNMPLLDDYYMSLVDFIVVSYNFNLPLVLIGSRNFKLNKHPFIITKPVDMKIEEGKYEFTEKSQMYIIKLSGIKRNVPFVFELVSFYDDRLILSLSMFRAKFIEYLRDVAKQLPSKIDFNKSFIKKMIL